MTVKQKNRNDQRRKPDVGAKLNALPVVFKFAAESLKKMSERGGSAGSIVVNSYRNYNYKLIFALVMNTLKNIKIIKKIIHEVKLPKKVQCDDPFLMEILVGDLLYGKGLETVKQNSTAASIIALKDAITKQRDLLKKDYTNQNEECGAKYLRINHLKSTMQHVQSQLKTVGLQQVEYEKEKIKFKKFINKFKSIEDNQFMVDFHFPEDLIVLKPEAAAKLKKTDIIKKNKAMLQDKASFMAVEAMGVAPNQRIIDACCAPGGKTSVIATKMKNKGTILAFDLDKKRLLSANHLLKIYGVTCAQTQVQDFSKVKLKRLLKAGSNEMFDSIIIDPSCSGSGISQRVDYKPSKQEEGRLKKLQAFQVALLRHALQSDVSKSIVYCTCSTSVEENERVIEMALEESGVKERWDVDEVLPYWQFRGDDGFTIGPKCVRSGQESLTNGFFIAKLVRNQTVAPAVKEESTVPTKKETKKAKRLAERDERKKNIKVEPQEVASEEEEDGVADEEVEDEDEDVDGDEDDDSMSDEEFSADEEDDDEEAEDDDEEE